MNHWLLQQLGRHALVDAVSVRLDPLLHGPTGALSGHFYRMDVYGRPLDWDRIRNLQSPDHGRWLPGNLSRSSLFTDYAWVPHDDEVDFICEELPPRDEVEERGSRYLHAVYDRRHHRITHLDGAVRVYNADELTSREASHVRNAGKVGTRVKVFRSDHQIDPDVLGISHSRTSSGTTTSLDILAHQSERNGERQLANIGLHRWRCEPELTRLKPNVKTSRSGVYLVLAFS